MNLFYYSTIPVTSGPDHEPRFVAFNRAEEENDAALKTIRRWAWTTLPNKIKEQTADAALLAKLRASFEELFRYDEHGVPRVWKSEDDLDGVFKKAKDVVSTVVLLCQLAARSITDSRPHLHLREDRTDGFFPPPRQHPPQRRPPAPFPSPQLSRRVPLHRPAGPHLGDQATGHNLSIPTRRRCLLRRVQAIGR